MIALRFKLKILCFPQKLSRSRQWVRQSTVHCTTEAMTKHNSIINKEDIHDIKMYVCISLMFLKYDSVTPYILFDKDNSVTPYVFFHDDQ